MDRYRFKLYSIVIYELAIDNIHSMSLNEQCRQKMLLSAIKYSMIEVTIYICTRPVNMFHFHLGYQTSCGDWSRYQLLTEGRLF